MLLKLRTLTKEFRPVFFELQLWLQIQMQRVRLKLRHRPLALFMGMEKVSIVV